MHTDNQEPASVITADAGNLVPTEMAGVPLQIFSLAIGGKDWQILAARDHASLLSASDQFVAFPFGLLLWEAASVLAESLAADPSALAGRSVLELGAGVGLPGIVARDLGAASVQQTDHITQALELCRLNAEANGVTGIELALANWDAWSDDRSYDLIIGSDVIYERQAHAALAHILERNLAPGGRALFADPRRQDTPLFVEKMTGLGWRVTSSEYQAPSTLPGGPEILTIDVIEMRR